MCPLAGILGNDVILTDGNDIRIGNGGIPLINLKGQGGWGRICKFDLLSNWRHA